MASEKLYAVAPALRESGEWIKGATFITGVMPGREQVIACVAGYILYVHRFSSDGIYLGRTVHEIANWDDTLAWINEWKLVPALVRVRKFHSGFDSPTRGGFNPPLSTNDLPSHFDDGDFASEEDREASIRKWREEGAFVLFWDTTEHWIGSDGRGCS